MVYKTIISLVALCFRWSFKWTMKHVAQQATNYTLWSEVSSLYPVGKPPLQYTKQYYYIVWHYVWFIVLASPHEI